MTSHKCSLMCGNYDQVALDLMHNFYSKGYAGNPSAWVSGTDIDKEVAETVPCERCGTNGGRYEAWANSEGGYGVALSVCPSCDHATMF